MSAAVDALTAAHRHSAALKMAIATGRHDCFCGAFGPFRFSTTGSWFCRSHVEHGPDGLLRPIPQS